MLTISAAESTGCGSEIELLVGGLAEETSMIVGMTPVSEPVEQAQIRDRLAISAKSFMLHPIYV
jgi:hypothetical protein